jgi:hypothetical protein
LLQVEILSASGRERRTTAMQVDKSVTKHLVVEVTPSRENGSEDVDEIEGRYRS